MFMIGTSLFDLKLNNFNFNKDLAYENLTLVVIQVL
jgi:hypothetical protein